MIVWGWVAAAWAAPFPTAEESARLVRELVALPEPAGVDPLADWKAWEAVYARASTPEGPDGHLTVAQVKGLSLIVFLVDRQQGRIGANSEILSTDLVPRFEKDRDAFLAAWKESPWLAPSGCSYLGKHFGFEDRNAEGRAPFLTRHEGPIRAALGPEVGADCVERIRTTAP